ncbi:hypothetical protein L1856_25790 [Streptomyces sp. Tue 6430]|nr:hypothetical protein [Streptomyces sp. Tue 6430]
MKIPGLSARLRTRDAARRDGRRRRRHIRERRLGVLAREATAPPAPPCWRAGRGGRLLAVLWGAHFLWFVAGPAVGRNAGNSFGDWIFLGWATLVAMWMTCRTGMWRVCAGRSGVWITRFRTVMFLPWEEISRVDMRRDGLLEFFAGPRQVLAGLYAPARLTRMFGRPDAGQRTADVLTVMARHPHLRPETDPDRRLSGPPFAVWSPLALCALALAALVF